MKNSSMKNFLQEMYNDNKTKSENIMILHAYAIPRVSTNSIVNVNFFN